MHTFTPKNLKRISRLFFPFVFLVFSCNGQKKKDLSMTEHKHTNALINETSPYLLQHAHNPVDWVAWNDESLVRAKKEQKIMLVFF